MRFFGAAMTAAQQALFTTAADHLMGVVTGDVPDVRLRSIGGGPVNLAEVCDVPGLPLAEETIDDVVVYASVRPIDGTGTVVAEAAPCLVRARQDGRTTALGTIVFDSDDIASLAGGGRLQAVITHEMLHVLGVGTLWNDHDLLADSGLASVSYQGAQARAGCIDSGGQSACAFGVPVENSGAAGTRDGHWRESTFETELMTGYIEPGSMPFSAITIGALADLGYAVNRAAADPYLVPEPIPGPRPVESEPGWERPLSAFVWSIARDGRLERLQRR